MAKYKVELVETVKRYHRVVVESDTRSQSYEKAKAVVQDCPSEFVAYEEEEDGLYVVEAFEEGEDWPDPNDEYEEKY